MLMVYDCRVLGFCCMFFFFVLHKCVAMCADLLLKDEVLVFVMI